MPVNSYSSLKVAALLNGHISIDGAWTPADFAALALAAADRAGASLSAQTQLATILGIVAEPIQQQIADLRAACPYDGRRVTLHESRGGWKYTGVSGICTHLAADRRHMVLVVEHDPENYWPVGTTILAALDHETVPEFTDTGVPPSSSERA